MLTLANYVYSSLLGNAFKTKHKMEEKNATAVNISFNITIVSATLHCFLIFFANHCLSESLLGCKALNRPSGPPLIGPL